MFHFHSVSHFFDTGTLKVQLSTETSHYRFLYISSWLHVNRHTFHYVTLISLTTSLSLFINTLTPLFFIWLNQLPNTNNLWWIDVYYIVINYMFRRLWPSSGWWVNKNTHKHLHSACVFYTEDGGGVIGWGYEISCVLGKEGGVYGCVLC